MSRVDFEVVVVGGGVVGLACAAELVSRYTSVLLLEASSGFGSGTSSRNSGVIHAGLYYPAASLKAQLCVEGRELLYARCARDGVAHRRCGKLVVAVDQQEVLALQGLLQRAVENGATEVRWIGTTELQRLEPRVRGVAALWSPMTGIVDAHGLMDSYRRQALAGGAQLLLHSSLEGIERCPEGLRLWVRGPASPELQQVTARHVINAAGLAADRVAALAGLDVQALGYRQYYCKGDYFRLGPRLRGAVRHLVYPIPVSAGLGIHLTLDLAGELSAGPDAYYVDTVDYDVLPEKAAAFAAALQRYLPGVEPEDLEPNYAGVRPKLQPPSGGFRDFVIADERAHGVQGLVNLVGIESPGLTASEAIARRVVQLLQLG